MKLKEFPNITLRPALDGKCYLVDYKDKYVGTVGKTTGHEWLLITKGKTYPIKFKSRRDAIDCVDTWMSL